jgi:hypothetical protein
MLAFVVADMRLVDAARAVGLGNAAGTAHGILIGTPP